ncbi:MAG: YceI family protein [Caldilineaceae bacterium]
MTQFLVRKQYRWIVVLLLLVIGLAACQGSAAPTSDTAVESAVAPVGAEATATSVPTNDTAAEADEEPVAAGSGAKTFQLTAGTEARFYIDEILMGQDKTVVGVTSLVEGQITVDPANPTSAQVSPIRIDARDLTTDSDRRNGAIQRFVLQSNQEAYRYITFTPTAVEGMPATVTVGQPFAFTVTGDLTIRDVTRSESFPVTVTANSENELVGSGAITILREDYQLSIPSVPSVAWVADEVKLEIDFTATAQ